MKDWKYHLWNWVNIVNKQLPNYIRISIKVNTYSGFVENKIEFLLEISEGNLNHCEKHNTTVGHDYFMSVRKDSQAYILFDELFGPHIKKYLTQFEIENAVLEDEYYI